MTGPVDGGASAAVALNAVSASMIDSSATTMPVRVAGSPSFDRLRHSTTLSIPERIEVLVLNRRERAGRRPHR